MKVIQLTDTNFETQIIKADKLALIDFWADWCGPCKMLSPILDELASDYADKIIVGKVDVDNNPQLSTKYNIKTIPTILIFKNGKILETLQGSRAKTFFSEAIERHLF